jgi:hypothetical protein
MLCFCYKEPNKHKSTTRQKKYLYFLIQLYFTIERYIHYKIYTLTRKNHMTSEYSVYPLVYHTTKL